MPPLPRELRQSLDRTVVEARAAAEKAARAALSTLAVDRVKAFDQLSESDRALRRALRAKERQLGSYDGLVSEIAYQHWHRMLFARFLAENSLLIHPEAGVAVSLPEVADLAREEGELDHWVMAARFAAKMLPAIFREGDPELALRFAPEGRKRLEELLASLPASVFTSDDALGWVYQFWQSEKKQEVNKSGNKIGAAELPAVTQLFTEDYMVRFLLENSLGAWWAGRHPDSPLIERFTYLRFTDERTPAAGTFEGWPDRVAEVTVMDPCCGSGHFLTVAFAMLTAMRMEEEGLSSAQAGDAAIEQNLFGLEIDPRCTQIAAFALALSAWRSGGYRELPPPNIASSGIGVAGQLADWKKLAAGNEDLENALTALHEQFRNAPELGSLIDPRRATEEGHLFSVDYDEAAPLLEELLSREYDPETQVAGWAAAGIARAASLLARTYTLVATNVPYLNGVKQSEVLKAFSNRHHPDAKADLATVMQDRVTTLLSPAGCLAVVTPHAWFFLGSYEAFRRRLLADAVWELVARLGTGAFTGISGEVVSVILLLLRTDPPSAAHATSFLDVSEASSTSGKAEALAMETVQVLPQLAQLDNPDARVVLGEMPVAPLLSQVADAYWGLGSGDYPRFGRCFWEIPLIANGWIRELSTVKYSTEYGGREHVLLWEDGKGALANHPGAFVRGLQVWGKSGVLVSQMGDLPATLYTGEAWDTNCAPIIPRNPRHLPAVWAFCTSPQFNKTVRLIDEHIKVTNATLVKVPFDLDQWTKVAEELYPNGLPEPYSNDPLQWLFKGDPTDSTQPLQVAVARLLGYRWPAQEPDALDELADADGAVPIPAIAGEAPAAERLRALLQRAWGDGWSTGKLTELLSQTGASGKDLQTWLRDSFFASHARLFHNRPFIWHIWDGRKDGFGVLVNYHRLDRQLLDRIAHTLLGNWIEAQRDQVRKQLPGSEARLIAAEDLKAKLELIAEGESPNDIYVRWKLLAEQPIGWNPDLNDGVRVNIRPFIEAGVLRSKFTINWSKDRGRDPDGSERVNDVHLTRAEKQGSREKVGR
jgi:hypothetical protein